jgi:hypothetical protein
MIFKGTVRRRRSCGRMRVMRPANRLEEDSRRGAKARREVERAEGEFREAMADPSRSHTERDRLAMRVWEAHASAGPPELSEELFDRYARGG